MNAVIKCLDKDELDVTLANTYNDDKIDCIVFHLVFERYFPSKTITILFLRLFKWWYSYFMMIHWHIETNVMMTEINKRKPTFMTLYDVVTETTVYTMRRNNT